MLAIIGHQGDRSESRFALRSSSVRYYEREYEACGLHDGR